MSPDARTPAQELAWAAGFFDGEGNTQCSIRTRPNSLFKRGRSIKMSVGQVDPRPLYRFHIAINGLGKICGPYVRVKRPKECSSYEWRVTNLLETKAVIALLWDFLSEPKQEQIVKVLQKYEDGYGSYSQ